MKLLGAPTKLMLLAWLAAGCSQGGSPPATPPAGTGGSGGASAGTGGRGGSGGSTAGTGGVTAGGSGGNGGNGGSLAPAVGGSGGTSGAGGSGGAAGTGGGTAPDATSAPDATAGVMPDAASGVEDSNTPMTTDGGPAPSYAGEIPIYYGPPVGPIVEMQCPGDPTEGWTEYKDSFHLEYPFRVAANMRFSIINGIYNFTVFPNDSPHSPIAMGRNPRTEASYGGTRDKATVGTRDGVYAKQGFFTTGQRLYSADMLIEPSAYGSAIMQIHTTSPGGGPIGLRLTGGNLTNNGSQIISGSSVPGGLQNRWFNFKAAFNTADRQVRIWINNCLKATYTGARGDGRYYFKNGVYFCDDGGGCRTHFKNIHFYEK